MVLPVIMSAGLYMERWERPKEQETKASELDANKAQFD